MASVDPPFAIVPTLYRRVARWIAGRMPKGLFARALIIIIAPMVILQSVIAYAFMERHWQTVTRRLSAAVTQDIAALIDIAESYPQDPDYDTLTRIAGDRLNLDVDILPPGPLPPPAEKPFFSVLDRSLSNEIRRQIDDLSGSIRSAVRTWSKSACNSTRVFCGC